MKARGEREEREIWESERERVRKRERERERERERVREREVSVRSKRKLGHRASTRVMKREREEDRETAKRDLMLIVRSEATQARPCHYASKTRSVRSERRVRGKREES